MKSDIKSRNSDTVKNMVWWSWVEACDICGKHIHGHEIETLKEPDTDEKDYCIGCLHELLKNKKANIG